MTKLSKNAVATAERTDGSAARRCALPPDTPLLFAARGMSARIAWVSPQRSTTDPHRLTTALGGYVGGGVGSDVRLALTAQRDDNAVAGTALLGEVHGDALGVHVDIPQINVPPARHPDHPFSNEVAQMMPSAIPRGKGREGIFLQPQRSR